MSVTAEDSRILSNTAFVACIATVMAIVLGFLIAWTLTRTRLPGRARIALRPLRPGGAAGGHEV